MQFWGKIWNNMLTINNSKFSIAMIMNWDPSSRVPEHIVCLWLLLPLWCQEAYITFVCLSLFNCEMDKIVGYIAQVVRIEERIVINNWKSESISCPVMPYSLWPHGLQPIRLLCPWNSPSKNTGVACHSLLQEIFLTQGLNPGLLHCRQTLYRLNRQGKPLI